MNDAPQATNLADYEAPNFSVERVELAFDLHEEDTIVRAALSLRRQASGPLVLDGEDLALESIFIDDNALPSDAYTVSPSSLTIPDVPDEFTLRTDVRIQPQNNTKLEGLYKSSGNFCTQCEAEGFRRITYFLDRPDVTSVYSVRIEADRAKYPVLLSNGNLVDQGTADEGRHWVEWQDPYPNHPIFSRSSQAISPWPKTGSRRRPAETSTCGFMSSTAKRTAAATQWAP